MYPLVDGLLGLFSSSTPFQNWSLPARSRVSHLARPKWSYILTIKSVDVRTNRWSGIRRTDHGRRSRKPTLGT